MIDGRGMVPDVAGVPDAEVHLTVRNPVLVAPGMVNRTAAGKLLESLLAPRGERIYGGKAGDSVRTRDGSCRDSHLRRVRPAGSSSEGSQATRRPPPPALNGAGADAQDDPPVDLKCEQRSPGFSTSGEEPGAVNPICDPPSTITAGVLADLLAEEPIRGTGTTESADHRLLGSDVCFGNGSAIALHPRALAPGVPAARRLGIRQVNEMECEFEIRVHWLPRLRLTLARRPSPTCR